MAKNSKVASEIRSAFDELMVPFAEGMRKTTEQMMATAVEEVHKFLTATVQDILGSIMPEMVKMLTHSLNSILSPNSERLQTMERDTAYALQSLNDAVAALQHMSRSTQQAENGSSFGSDAEEQQRRRSYVFIGIAESCELPHLRHDRNVESVAVILDEWNVDASQSRCIEWDCSTQQNVVQSRLFLEVVMML